MYHIIKHFEIEYTDNDTHYESFSNRDEAVNRFNSIDLSDRIRSVVLRAYCPIVGHDDFCVIETVKHKGH